MEAWICLRSITTISKHGSSTCLYIPVLLILILVLYCILGRSAVTKEQLGQDGPAVQDATEHPRSLPGILSLTNQAFNTLCSYIETHSSLLVATYRCLNGRTGAGQSDMLSQNRAMHLHHGRSANVSASTYGTTPPVRKYRKVPYTSPRRSTVMIAVDASVLDDIGCWMSTAVLQMACSVSTNISGL